MKMNGILHVFRRENYEEEEDNKKRSTRSVFMELHKTHLHIYLIWSLDFRIRPRRQLEVGLVVISDR